MKQLTLKSWWNALFLLAIVVSFSACMDNLAVEKEELKQDDQTAMIYDRIIQTDNTETRRVISQSLSEAEKISFWRYHVDQIISNQNLSQVQISVLNDAKEFITKSRQELANDPNFDPAKVEAYFNAIPAEVFSKKQLAQMFVLSQLGDNIQIGVEEPESAAAVNCGCINNLGCRGGRKCTSQVSCTRVRDCGPGGLFNCSGVCRFLVPQEEEPEEEEPEGPGTEGPGTEGPGSGTEAGI